jgi:hypothetical protein
MTANHVTPQRLLPWYDLLDWPADPRLAYAKGLHDGYELGHAAANTELVAALAQALGGPGCVDYRQAVRGHLAAVAAKTRRDAADRITDAA